MKIRLISIFVLIAMLVPAQALAAPAERTSNSVTIPGGGPTFWIHDVDRDNTVTIRVTNYTTNDKFLVSIGRIGNAFGSGIGVGTLTGDLGKTFNATFNIPSVLKGEVLLAIQLQNKQTAAYGYDIFQNTDGWTATQGYWASPLGTSSADFAGNSVYIFQGPTFWVHSVDAPTKVTLKFDNFPQHEKYVVFLGEDGTQFGGGNNVGVLDGDYGVNFTVTFDIPGGLQDDDVIVVRVENTFTGHFGYLAFTNEDDFRIVDLPGMNFPFLNAPGGYGSSGTPYTRILNVVQDSEVTLQTFNFPADTNFDVTMGFQGTYGIGGVLIGVQNSGPGGSFIVTFPIPDALKGQQVISLRMQSQTSGHYAYDFFYNQDGYNYLTYTTGTGTTAGSAYTLPPGVIPTFSIIAVDKDNTVTITGTNFTKNDTYTVLMGAYGTLGVGGINSGTVTTGANGVFTATVSIPAGLQGLAQIAIRLESNNSAYYSYNFFTNADYP